MSGWMKLGQEREQLPFKHALILLVYCSLNVSD